MDTKNKYSKITLADVKKNQIIKTFIKSADDHLGKIGYTEHGKRHVSLVASTAKDVLLRLGYSERYQELAEIAGYTHDIGNIVNRQDHGRSSALIAMRLLKDMKMSPKEVALIISAIGNHEQTGDPMNPIAAALILADKSDVHKTRVRKVRRSNTSNHNIHERVNHAVKKSFLKVNKNKKIISLYLVINIQKFSVMEYFEIFMERMVICKRAAEFFKCKFSLTINKRKLL